MPSSGEGTGLFYICPCFHGRELPGLTSKSTRATSVNAAHSGWEDREGIGRNGNQRCCWCYQECSCYGSRSGCCYRCCSTSRPAARTLASPRADRNPKAFKWELFSASRRAVFQFRLITPPHVDTAGDWSICAGGQAECTGVIYPTPNRHVKGIAFYSGF
jgi:hypothetical protein